MFTGIKNRLARWQAGHAARVIMSMGPRIRYKVPNADVMYNITTTVYPDGSVEVLLCPSQELI